VWIDLGGGTGANLVFAGKRLSQLARVQVVDLCPPLLAIADHRIRQNGWNNVSTIFADATTFEPREAADVVTFSYSLTMIPDWFAAIDRAHQFLKPGGLIGVVDFHISRKYVENGSARHGWLTRSLLPLWFGNDNVFLSQDHLPYLERRFRPVALKEERSRIPWLPFVRAPYYLFIGRKE
jgi:S-adenosylmethionine-diacylgycerolhomoserine-N-methlytransferase